MTSRSSKGRSLKRWEGPWFLKSGGLILVIVLSVWTVRTVVQGQRESRLKYIDDFNHGNAAQNLIGGLSDAQASEGSSITSRCLPTGFWSPRAMALELQVHLAPQGGANWTTNLNGLDISAATHLSFWIRTIPSLPPLTIEIVDHQHHARSRALSGLLTRSTRWQQVRLSLEEFPDLDWNQLDRFQLRFSARSRPLDLVVMLDDLAFEGPRELFFESLRDNVERFPTYVHVNADRIARMPDGAMLRTIAADTWGYFRDLVDRRSHLPLNSVQLAPARQIGDYTSPTDIAMYLLGIASAYDLDLINRDEALQRLRATVTQLASLAVWRHFFYNYYSTTNLQIARYYVSSVDNGWLAAALVVIRTAFPELADQCTGLLDRMDFRVFYDEQHGQMRLGYDTKRDAFEPYHYGLLVSEARMLSLVAIGKGDVPEEHWFRIYRTLPKEWDWQRQVPQGLYRQYRGHDVFQGHYTYDGVAFVPSWGGSLFEFLMPTLLVKEHDLAPQGLGLNDQRAAELHRRYALQERRYPVWGISPSAQPNPGGYAEFGVKVLGSKGYEDYGVVTPHSGLLALEFLPQEVIENVRQFLQRYPIYGEYGLYDAVDVHRGRIAYRYLALDQGMSLLAINNYLNEGILRKRFHADPVGRRIEWLLQSEQFF